MNDVALWEIAAKAFATLLTRDVPGSLLAMSLILNVVLLAPSVIRSIWRK